MRMYRITDEHRERASTGSETVVWQSADGRVIHFLNQNMQIVVFVSQTYEPDHWFGPYPLHQAREMAERYKGPWHLGIG